MRSPEAYIFEKVGAPEHPTLQPHARCVWSALEVCVVFATILCAGSSRGLQAQSGFMRGNKCLGRFTCLLAALVLGALVSGCAYKKEPVAPEVEPGIGTTLPGPPVPAVVVAPTASAVAQAQRDAMEAVDALEEGNEDLARSLLKKALAEDPSNKLASSLMRQIVGDPQLMFGRESFPYTVKSGESLSKIAGHFLGDIYMFYGLARYNDIRVPKQVAGGQVIKVPGKAPPPEEREVTKPVPLKPGKNAAVKGSAPLTAPEAAPTAPLGGTSPGLLPAAPAPIVPVPTPVPEVSAGAKAMAAAADFERSANLERALTEYRRAAGLDQPGAAAKVESIRKQLVTQYTGRARRAFAGQDLDGAIAHWNKVLELEPANDIAKLERQKALSLKEKIKGLK